MVIWRLQMTQFLFSRFKAPPYWIFLLLLIRAQRNLAIFWGRQYDTAVCQVGYRTTTVKNTVEESLILLSLMHCRWRSFWVDYSDDELTIVTAVAAHSSHIRLTERLHRDATSSPPAHKSVTTDLPRSRLYQEIRVSSRAVLHWAVVRQHR